MIGRRSEAGHIPESRISRSGATASVSAVSAKPASAGPAGLPPQPEPAEARPDDLRDRSDDLRDARFAPPSVDPAAATEVLSDPSTPPSPFAAPAPHVPPAPPELPASLAAPFERHSGADTPDVATLLREIRRLSARVAWLEDRVRDSRSVPFADFEDFGEAVFGYADAVYAAREAESSLLTPHARETLQGALDWFGRLQRERDRADMEVLAISATLESTRRTDPEHIRQVARFPAAEQGMADANAALAAYSPTVRTAVRRLAADDAARASARTAVEAGARERRRLFEELRSRVRAEAAQGALVPSWFGAAFGPLRHPVEPERLEAAVEALAYRLVYRIEDAGSLLGPPPGAQASGHQQEEFTRVAAQLARLDGGR